MNMPENLFIVPTPVHDSLVRSAYLKRGFDATEAEHAVVLASAASKHGIRTHNAIKALHLDDLFGSKVGGCVPQATIKKLPSRFAAVEIWDAQKKLGQSVAWEAINTCMRLADTYGSGCVSIDNAFHYLWGGGYVMEAAKKGYIAYTNCTAALTEVVPFKGTYPTLGTNPHSWAFPTTEAVGFPIVIDWATSVIAMGRVQQFKREGTLLPANAAVDKSGQPTVDPNEAVSLLPFGEHKGYGLSLMNEIMAGFIGGSLPTLRSRAVVADEKQSCTFFFQAIHPEAISGSAFAKGRSQSKNVQAVLSDILGHGNSQCLLPGQLEAEAAIRSEKAGGLLFSQAEINALNDIAHATGSAPLNTATLTIASAY